jgi:hypothetical protein
MEHHLWLRLLSQLKKPTILRESTLKGKEVFAIVLVWEEEPVAQRLLSQVEYEIKG